MKLRDPDSIEFAVMQIIAVLGRERANAAVGKSPKSTLVQRWSDPEDDLLPDHYQGEMLDDACEEAGGGRPIGTLLEGWRQRHHGEPAHQPSPPWPRQAEVGRAIGGVLEKVPMAHSTEAPTDIKLARNAIRDCIATLAALDRDLHALLPVVPRKVAG